MPQVCLAALLVLSVLVEAVTSSILSPDEEVFVQTLRNRFEDSSRSELLHLWHNDCHRRCRWQINAQIDVACNFDPYRYEFIRSKRETGTNEATEFNVTLSEPPAHVEYPTLTKDDTDENKHLDIDTKPDLPPFLAKHMASNFFRESRKRGAKDSGADKPLRRMKRGVDINEECCYSKACAWEEFGEYCTMHPRVTTDRASVCTYDYDLPIRH